MAKEKNGGQGPALCTFCASKATHYVKLVSHDLRTTSACRQLCWWCTEVLEGMFPAQVYVTDMTTATSRRYSRKLLKRLRRELDGARMPNIPGWVPAG